MSEKVYRSDLGICYFISLFNFRITLTISQGRRGSVSLHLLCYDINTEYDACLILALMVKENSESSEGEGLVCSAGFSRQANRTFLQPPHSLAGGDTQKGWKTFSFLTKLLLEEGRQDCKTRVQRQLSKRASLLFPDRRGLGACPSPDRDIALIKIKMKLMWWEIKLTCRQTA